ncbi:TetR/AcrR family transcriptional regulator [Oceanobacillus rekensis]|uniref:TetR/AcrR family transcriptional regulator n=1 Tax=Oceanobacillus rekensis TaxID=937927 RepID=UPI000B43565E|nr:TetR/AcrR family transcriptional regulator [Oceanobacillus rekensis]
MSKGKIKKIAISHFNKFGYEGTKLSQIAEEVGIRKQSLAYHFPHKRLLFQEVYKEAVEEEVQFIKHYFLQHAEKPIEQQLYHFLTEHKVRFQTNPNTQLMLTISFLVPDEMYEDVIQKPYKYINILTGTLESCFAKQTFRISAKECALAFVALLDGLDIQLVYEDSRKYEKLQEITWDIFWTGISL